MSKVLETDVLSIESMSPTQMHRHLVEQGLSDGMPVVPPLPEDVARLCDAIGRDPAEEVGEVSPVGNMATVGAVASNAVMAGCDAPQFAVVLAALEACLEEQFNLNGIQATTHPCAPLIIVNGPIRDEAGIESGAGLFGYGLPASLAVGRALRLVLWNIGGARPGLTDKAPFGHGSKISFCCAEAEEKSPWAPFHVDRGFNPEDSVVTVFAGDGPRSVNDHLNGSGKLILETVADTMAVSGINNAYLWGEMVVVIGPEHAKAIQEEGFSRADTQRFLFEKAQRRFDFLSTHGMYGRQGWGAEYSDAAADAEVPMVERPEEILLIVAGGTAGRFSSVIPGWGGTYTRPVSRKIETPIGGAA